MGYSGPKKCLSLVIETWCEEGESVNEIYSLYIHGISKLDLPQLNVLL